VYCAISVNKHSDCSLCVKMADQSWSSTYRLPSAYTSYKLQ